EIIELPRRRWRAFVAVPVAAAVLVAGFALWTGGPGASGPDSGERVVAESAGEKSMHAIMAAEDLMTANANASGATLDIVSSAEMDKSGAMVDGQPRLDAGMGAQVWAVSADGTVTSAGVIGQDPHDGVWMPFEGEAVKVMVTEEPMAGSAEPTGRTLAEVRLS
ncbi:anti-sigma factor, partial [Corynebacterium sp.]|uniref:anti-sigma factor n=1 Tax=Corynebacterium sp. TaxID=1720 RepID=UPI0026DD28ED